MSGEGVPHASDIVALEPAPSQKPRSAGWLSGALTVMIVWGGLECSYQLGVHRGVERAISVMKSFNAGKAAGLDEAVAIIRERR